MTRAELDQYIDDNVTNKNAVDSLSPTDEGNSMKQIADYVDQEVALKENAANKSNDSELGTSDTLFPTQNAVKEFVEDRVVLKRNLSNKSTNVSTDGLSDVKYPSVKAVKTYADGSVAGLLDDRGNYTPSPTTGGAYPTTGGSGVAGAIMVGDIWFIDTDGYLGTVAVTVGVSFRALVDSPGQTPSNWGILNVGLGYVPENVANKSTDPSLGTSDTLYPTQNAVKSYVDANSGTQSTKVLKTTITEAEILNLNSSPVIILPENPDPSIFTQLISVLITRSGAGTSYACPSNLYVSTRSETAFPIPSMFEQALTFTAFNSIGFTTAHYEYNSSFPNEYKLHSNVSNPTGGTGDINVYATYIEITL